MRNSRGLNKLIWLLIIVWVVITGVVACWVLSDVMKPEYEKKTAAGVEARNKGDDDKAEALLLEAVALGKKANARGEGMILAVRHLGLLYLASGDYQRAGKYLNDALEYARADSEFAKRLTLVCLCDWERAAYDQGALEKQDSKYADEFLEGQTKQPLTFYGHDLVKPYGSKIFSLIANKDYVQAQEWLNKGLAEKKIEDWRFDRPKIALLVKLGKARDAVALILSEKKRFPDNRSFEGQLQQAMRAAAGDPSGTDGIGTIPVLFKTNQLIDRKDFAGLDKYAAELVATKAQDRSGHWDIEDFYDCLSLSDDSLTSRILERQAFLNDWMKAHPTSDATKIAMAHLLEHYAWKARGSGFANTVTKDGWKLFGERLQQAQDILEKVKKRDPGYYSAQQTLALGQSWESPQYEQIYQECRKAYPDYVDAIQQKINWMRARWHGEEGDSLRVLEGECNKLPGVAGDILYAKLCARMIRWSYWNLREEPAINWTRAKRGFKAMIAANPGSLWPRADMASVAMQVDQPEDAKAAFETFTAPKAVIIKGK